MSQRIQKVESLVQQTVARALPELLGEARTRITVTAVDVSPDLRNATVWFGVIGQNPEAVLAELLSIKSDLQRRVAAIMTTKFVPKLTLKLDSGGAYAEHIERLLRGI